MQDDGRTIRGDDRDAGPSVDPTVLYIGGWGRSGSTLLECVLAGSDRTVALGEVVWLWERGLVLDELCACGQPFHDCPFWTEVGRIAFGGWDRVDATRMATLKDAVDRQRRMVQSARRTPGPAFRSQVREYAGHFQRVYRAASAVTGARVVIDSSKEIPTALALSHLDDLDLRVLHIVRDSRGVAYSWSKVVERPEAGGEPMPQFSPTKSTALWLSGNLAVVGLTHRGVPLTRLRYEDLVAEPAETIERAWQALDLPGRADVPMVDATTVDLRPTHSVAGNPMRFRTGLTELRRDDAWRTEMSPRDRRLVTALSYPALKSFGYLERDR